MKQPKSPSVVQNKATKALPQVRLRALEMSDLDLLYQVENDPELADCTTNLMPLSRVALKHFIQRSLTGDLFSLRQYRFVIEAVGLTEDSTSNFPVGFIDLIDFSPEHRRAEVGIAILAPHRGQGYATIALQQLSHWAQQQLSLVQLYAYAQEHNLPSHCVFEKAGFRATALLPAWFVKGGMAQDARLYQLIFGQNQ